MLDRLPQTAQRVVLDCLLCRRNPHESVAWTLSAVRGVSREYCAAVDDYRRRIREALYAWCVAAGAGVGCAGHLAEDVDRAHIVSTFGLSCHAINPRTPASIFPATLRLRTFCDDNVLDATFLMIFTSPTARPTFYCKVYLSKSVFRIESSPVALLVRCPREWWDDRDFASVLTRF